MADRNNMRFAALNRLAAAEGAVLLKNEGRMLPIQVNETTAVFGRPQIDYYRSGTGSGGSVNVEYATNILCGLRENQANIHEGLAGRYTDWCASNPPDDGGGAWAAEPWFQNDMPLHEDLVRQVRTESEKAVYIIGRTAGEDKDNGAVEGSYYLTAQERENLKLITRIFEQVAVVMNISNVMDMSWVDDPVYEGHICGVLLIWQGGMEGGRAAADILCGRISPGGKLPDTIARHIEDYPAHRNFGNQDRNIYEEDIYVGYRYFETFCPERVQYSFGYGMSYTTFSVDIMGASIVDGSFCAEVEVSNTGYCHGGQEVVQLYYEAPQGSLGKPVRQLGAFSKTRVLEPGEHQTIELRFPLRSMASYDDSGLTGHKSCYVLEQGVYRFYVGTSVRQAQEVSGCSYKLDHTMVVEELSEAMAPEIEFKVMKPGAAKENGTYERCYTPVSRKTVDLNQRITGRLPQEHAITGYRSIMLRDVREQKESLEDFVAQLSIEELAMLVRGEGMSHPGVTSGTASAFGGVSNSLSGYGIPLACCADGPSGLRMEEKTVQLPIGTLLASTWNPELVRELYRMEGYVMTAHQVDVLLGPGVNIHRHPLNGRNFEYFSEDPCLTGIMAVAVCGGLKDGGADGTVKHFACNNQETNRRKLETVCSERAIREIYLKGFEQAVKSGTVMSVMTAYNPVNGHWTASNYDLNTTILRGEWGYSGIVMTDWWAAMNDVAEGGPDSGRDTRDMIRAQNDLYMVVNNYGAEINSGGDNTCEAAASGKLTVGELQRCALNICRFLLQSPAMTRVTSRHGKTEKFPAVPGERGRLSIGCETTIETGDSEEFSLEVEEAGVYTVIVTLRSLLDYLSQSACRLALGQKTLALIQTNGTDGRWISQTVTKAYLEAGCHVLTVQHIQAGIEMKSIRIKK